MSALVLHVLVDREHQEINAWSEGDHDKGADCPCDPRWSLVGPADDLYLYVRHQEATA